MMQTRSAPRPRAWMSTGPSPKSPRARLFWGRRDRLAGRSAAPLTSRVLLVRVRRSLRVTPTMAAGVTDRV